MATMKQLDAEALANTLADKLSKIKAETLAKCLGHVHSKALLYTWLTRYLNCMLRKVQTDYVM